MQAAISKAKRTDKKEKSSQDSIPYLLMRQDGICQVTRDHYTKTIQFRDINYQLSDNEDKQAIFDSWCDFLNYFDSSVSFQLSFINLTGLRGAALRTIPVRTDRFESIQRELSGVIQNQQEKGNNGIVKTKYLTFGIDADSVRSAKPRLERIETDILNNFKKLGVSAQVLTGKERLKVCHDILRMDTPEPFLFRWEDLPRSGLSTKDYIAPSSFYFGRARDFRMGRKFATVSFLQILAPELSDRVLKDFLDIESNVIVNIHVQSVDQVRAIKTIKRTITDLDKTKIEEQKKAVRAGYDMDILPSDLATYGEEAKKLLSDFLFAFRREESLAEPRAIGGELLAQIDARDAVAGVFAAQDEHLLVHERGEADRGLIERGHQFPHVRSPGFHHVDLAAHHGAELHHLERHRKKPRLVVLADIAELDEAVEEAVHRALLQRQGLAYLKGLVRAVGAEEFQNVENFL